MLTRMAKIGRYLSVRGRLFCMYLVRLILATCVNAAIMIPLVYGVDFLLKYLGYDMVAPENLYPLDFKDPLMLAVMALGIGIFEETYFRYLVQDCLLTQFLKLHWRIGWILASLAFGFAHSVNPGSMLFNLPQMVGACGAGLWFGYIYRKYGLHFAILTHALYDFIIFYCYGLM